MKFSLLSFVAFLFSFSAFNSCTCSEQDSGCRNVCEDFPEFYYWDYCDSMNWIPFNDLPFRGMHYDSVVSLIGEPNFAEGCKMRYGINYCGGCGCDIAAMFRDDSIAVVNWYTWINPVDTSSRPPMLILFFEETSTHAKLDTPIWGCWFEPRILY